MARRSLGRMLQVVQFQFQVVKVQVVLQVVQCQVVRLSLAS